MKPVTKKPRVLLALSGGVDSSVAALLMKQKGYEVIAVFMKCFSDSKDPLTGECNWREERRSATKIASLLDIPLHTLDFEKEYQKLVIKEMISSYKKGITPNPDVDCNNKIKFPLLWKAAKKFKCDYVVTGHYARIKQSNSNKSEFFESDYKLGNSIENRAGQAPKGAFEVGIPDTKNFKNKKKLFEFHRAKAENKDQSYFLYRITQKDLSHMIFPIGDFSKEEVREIAKKNNFPNFDKKGTSGICFVGKINVKEYLKHKIKPKIGDILDPQGNKVGTHDGIYYYTIGERIGPRHGIEFTKQGDDPKNIQRWYVASKDVKKNILIVAPKDHPLLLKKEIKVHDLHLINPKEKLPKEIDVRIRHVGELLPVVLNKNKVILKEPITGISEGQAIVFYKKNSSLVLGGGVISFR